MTQAIPRTVVNPILQHALSQPEQEVCGLVGRRDAQFTVYPVRNVAKPPQALFAMDPQQQIEAMRRMRERGENLFAIYHSHPRAPATPSALDVEQAAYPEALYLIISLDTEGVLDMRAHRLHGGRLQPVELEMVND